MTYSTRYALLQHTQLRDRQTRKSSSNKRTALPAHVLRKEHTQPRVYKSHNSIFKAVGRKQYSRQQITIMSKMEYKRDTVGV